LIRASLPKFQAADLISDIFQSIHSLSELSVARIAETDDWLSDHRAESGGEAMAIRNPRQLARRLRQIAMDCEKNASKDVLPDDRGHLLKTAEHCRTLAYKIDEPGGKWEAVLRSFGLTSAD
jgi:hypothetical protein